MHSAGFGLADSQTRTEGWNALFFADTLHVQLLTKQDDHATPICTSCVGAINARLALNERRRRYCKEASLPGRTVKAWERSRYAAVQ